MLIIARTGGGVSGPLGQELCVEDSEFLGISFCLGIAMFVNSLTGHMLGGLVC